MIILLPNINDTKELKKSGTWVEPWDLMRQKNSVYWNGIEVMEIDRDREGFVKIISKQSNYDEVIRELCTSLEYSALLDDARTKFASKQSQAEWIEQQLLDGGFDRDKYSASNIILALWEMEG